MENLKKAEGLARDAIVDVVEDERATYVETINLLMLKNESPGRINTALKTSPYLRTRPSNVNPKGSRHHSLGKEPTYKPYVRCGSGQGMVLHTLRVPT